MVDEASMRVTSETYLPEDWDQIIEHLPGAHVLQTREWGIVKSHFGWQPIHKIWRNPSGKIEAAAMVLQRTFKLPLLSRRLSVIYVPKGPLLDWGDERLYKQVLQDLISLARERKAIFVKIDPDLQLGTGVPGEDEAVENPIGSRVTEWLGASGWRYSREQIQFRNTVLINLEPSIEDLLANMKQKTRYNVRLSKRKGVQVRVGEFSDLDTLYQMYVETSVRDGFVIRSADYYQEVWNTFIKAGLAQPLIAEVDDQIVAAIVVFRFAGKAWYIHGMSRPLHRNKMPNYQLQWKAIKRAKESGCTEYDLWGAPEVHNQNDPLWGVFRFKDGFGGKVVRHLGAYDYPVSPFYYYLYSQVLPRVLDLMRWRGKNRAERMIST